MRIQARLWGLGKFLLLVGALIATFLLFALVAARVAIRAREVPVPNLVGATVAGASTVAADLDLALRIDPNQRPDEKVPAGSIMQQDPAPGGSARQQRTIRVWVSAGPRANSVPPLVGQSERTARMRIEQDGLEVGSLTEFRSPDYPADAVVAQDPAPSSRAPKVSMLLNRGEQATTYVMPDLIGMNGERASAQQELPEPPDTRFQLHQGVNRTTKATKPLIATKTTKNSHEEHEGR